VIKQNRNRTTVALWTTLTVVAGLLTFAGLYATLTVLAQATSPAHSTASMNLTIATALATAVYAMLTGGFAAALKQRFNMAYAMPQR